MTLRETDLVINEGLTISGKSMRHLEVINHQEAIAYIKDLMQKNSSINERTSTVYTQSYFERNSTRRPDDIEKFK
jgi:hypothetical protein